MYHKWCGVTGCGGLCVCSCHLLLWPNLYSIWASNFFIITRLSPVGLVGLRKFISSHRPLDCWGSAFPGYRQWVCRNSVAINRRENSVVVVKDGWERGGRSRDAPSGSHETSHLNNSNGWQGIPGTKRGSPSNGLWGSARETLEHPVERPAQRVLILEKQSVGRDYHEGSKKLDSGYLGWVLWVQEGNIGGMGRPKRWILCRKV